MHDTVYFRQAHHRNTILHNREITLRDIHDNMRLLNETTTIMCKVGGHM